MKLHQMNVFREIMLTGSVSEAARNLNRSQPSVSAAIAALEDELEMKLFERRAGRLHPVPEARYLAEECSELLGRVETLKRNMRDLSSLEKGHIQIISMPGPSVFLVPDMIATFLADKPEASCELISRASETVHQQIAAQQYDIGIADYAEILEEKSALLNVKVFNFHCLCVMTEDDPLAGHEVITAEDLDGKPLASLYAGHESRISLTRFFSEAGCQLNARFSTRYFLPILTFVERRLAYGVVDPIAEASYRLYNPAGKLIFKPFCPAVGFRNTVLNPIHRTASLLSGAFLEELYAKMSELSGTPAG